MTDKKQIKNNKDGSITLTAKISKDKIADAYESVLEERQETTEIKGFRKGKAPKKQIEKAIGEEKIYQQAVNQLLPKVYQNLIQKHDLEPIIAPRADFVSAKPDEDWEVEFTTCELPEIKLGDYKETIKAEKAKSKIWTPNQGEPKEEKKPQAKQAQKQQQLRKIIEILTEEVDIDIPDVLIEREVNQKMAQLIDKTEKMGISLEQYAESSGKKIPQIRKAYQKKAKGNWQLELALNKIAEEEDIDVDKEEIDQFIENVKDEKQKEQLEKQRYMLASITRRQKALEFLQNL